ncbi:MAG: transcriptional regulator, TetR family [Myxococcaceae bacterium]|jgi:AcrR family transcriptional regulator|nr:transcriptional regulator, TetR family [Myxococcaceae bacterium]
MGSNERRERERLETRKKILDAARELFVTHGFDAVTMRKIAEKIEYTPTAIYFHFKDKETLVRELCVADFLDFGQKFAKAAAEPDVVERLKKSGHAYAEFATKYPNSYRLMFMSPARPTDGMGDVAWKGNPAEDAYAFLKLTVTEAMEKGLVREELTDPELVAQIVWSGMHGVVSLQIAMSCDQWTAWRPLKERVKTMIDVLIRGLFRATPESGPPAKAPAKKRKG